MDLNAMQQGPRLPPNIPTTLHRNEAVAVTFQLQIGFRSAHCSQSTAVYCSKMYLGFWISLDFWCLGSLTNSRYIRDPPFWTLPLQGVVLLLPTHVRDTGWFYQGTLQVDDRIKPCPGNTWEEIQSISTPWFRGGSRRAYGQRLSL